MITRLLLALPLFFHALALQTEAQENRIPFYEDYLQKSDLVGFIRDTKKFLAEKPDAKEAPRMAMDYLMAAKAARNSSAFDQATGYLLFRYPNSLPTLHLLSSFEKGSERLREIINRQADVGDLGDKDFAVAYCRTLILIARAQDPNLLKDAGLRLRAYLLAVKAEVEEIEQVALKTLSKDAQSDSSLSKSIKIVLSEKETMEKIIALDAIGGKDADFCIKYYLAQLAEEEKKSPELLTLQLKQSLFKKKSDLENAFLAFSALPAKTMKLPMYQTFLGVAQHFDKKDEEAIKTLKEIPTKSSNKEMAEWGKTAHTYADGLQNSESRKKLLLDALGKSVDRLGQESGAFYVEAEWFKSEDKKQSNPSRIHLGVSKSEQSFELQILEAEKLIFAFRTDAKTSAVLPPRGEKIISFKSPGVLPLPRVTIIRDIGDGSFNYNFNLSFAPSFGKLTEEGTNFLKNPYIGTNKGREVLLSYLLSSKPIWLAPAKSIKGGTAYPIFSIDPESPTPNSAEIGFDLSGNLNSCRFGALSIPTILRGDQAILDQMPDWPELAKREEEKFDFALIMEMITQLSKLAKDVK